LDATGSGHGTAYQRSAFIVTSLLTGQILIHFIRRGIIILVVLLAFVFVVAVTFTWQTGYSHNDWTSVVVWCMINGAVAGVLRSALYGVYPTLFGRSQLDSALLHANLWDSVGAAMSVVVSDWLCLVIRAWFVIFVAGAASVAFGALECACGYRSDCRSAGSAYSDVAEAAADRESLASVCISPNEAASLSTISSNRHNAVLRLQPLANRVHYTTQTSHPAD